VSGSAGPEISVVVVTYNSEGHIDECLAALTQDPEIEVIVIDNDSGDRTTEVIRSRFPSVTLIENHTNTGFAAAVNEAAAHSRGDALLLLNPDATISRDSVHRLAAELRTPGVAVAAPRIVHPTGRLEIMSAGRQPFIWPMFAHFSGLSRLSGRLLHGHYLRQSSMAGAERLEVGWATGACLMVRASVWRKLGGLSDRWFMYAEDIEFCWRVRQAGYRIVVLPELTATHVVGASSDPSRPADAAWVINLFDFYRDFLAPSRVHSLLWKIVVSGGLRTRSWAFRLRAALRRHDRDVWATESERFRRYASTLWSEPITPGIERPGSENVA
jgi:N-acetylglucosaminyl-diphospho-decaprenol L-rhamnosyltransferase